MRCHDIVDVIITPLFLTLFSLKQSQHTCLPVISHDTLVLCAVAPDTVVNIYSLHLALKFLSFFISTKLVQYHHQFGTTTLKKSYNPCFVQNSEKVLSLNHIKLNLSRNKQSLLQSVLHPELRESLLTQSYQTQPLSQQTVTMSPSKCFNLMGLPTEIRLNILEYIFPLNDDGSNSVTFEIYQDQTLEEDVPPNTAQCILQPRPSKLGLKRYLHGIARVNKRLHAESMRVLYARSFVLEFADLPFGIPLSQAFSHDLPSRWWWTQYPAWPGDRDRFIPGLDLGRVKELRIVGRDHDAWNYWACVIGSVRDLCKSLSHRIAVQGLRKLTVAVEEGEEPVIARPEYVMGLLEMPWLYLRGVGECEVVMPSRTIQNEEVARSVKGMTRAVVSSWRTGDWVADEEAKLPKPRYYSRKFKEHVPWELTTDHIENDKCFLDSEKEILWTEMTAQDRKAYTFKLHWRLTDLMEHSPGHLLLVTRFDGICYYWESDEKMEDEDRDAGLWMKNDWDTEDDFCKDPSATFFDDEW